MKPIEHSHLYSNIGKSMHLAPFWHGLEAQPLGDLKVFSHLRVFGLKNSVDGHCMIWNFSSSRQTMYCLEFVESTSLSPMKRPAHGFDGGVGTGVWIPEPYELTGSG